MRDPASIARASARLEGRIEVERAIQYLFHRQWELLVDHARSLGVALIGDLPIFVAHDSADVWSRPDLFHLGSDGRPTVVAGVPPDYFAATGQRWGNPLYDWEAHRSELYEWWADRLRATFARFDMVRIDHFRGFVAFWEIPASEPTAVNGHWVEGPGHRTVQRSPIEDRSDADHRRGPGDHHGRGHQPAAIPRVPRHAGRPVRIR